MLFVDYSSASNTILPHKALSLSTGSPKGCVLSPLLFSLYTHDCFPCPSQQHHCEVCRWHHSGGDESAYRDEVEWLSTWCRANNLLLNTSKTKELITDYRIKKTEIPPLIISGDCVERVADFCFLGVDMEESLSWSMNTSELLKKAQQRQYFLRILRRNNITQRLLVSFYRASIESILTHCMCVWYTSCTVAQKKVLQRVINIAQKIVGCPLPTLEELHSSRCLKKAQNSIKDTPHPGHSLFVTTIKWTVQLIVDYFDNLLMLILFWLKKAITLWFSLHKRDCFLASLLHCDSTLNVFVLGHNNQHFSQQRQLIYSLRAIIDRQVKTIVNCSPTKA